MRFFYLSSLPSIATSAMSGVEEVALRIRRVYGNFKEQPNKK